MNVGKIIFANPEYLFLLIGLLPIIVWYVLKNNDTQASLQVSSISGFEKAPKTFKHYLKHILFGFRLIIIALLIIVIARPQSTDSWANKTTRGIDIIMCIDISGSMLAMDFTPNRIEAAKNIGIEFIQGRPNDRIGLVAFSAESFTQCPLTTDHAQVINLLKELKSGMIEDGTAIGLGLANAINRLKESKAISKVIILLTDGMNNAGSVAPITAAEIARTFGIRVYTIGVGTLGQAPYPFQTPFGTQIQNVPVEIDEDVLRNIAQMTDGQYFRATSNQKLRAIYNEIDKLEKTKIEVKEYSRKDEKYMFFAIAAFILLLFEIVLRTIFLKSIP
jgi:Ca-activated chloride channel family protein